MDPKRGRPSVGVRIELRIPPETAAALDAAAERAGVTRAAVSRRVLVDHAAHRPVGKCAHCDGAGFVSIGWFPARWFCLGHLTKAIADIDLLRTHAITVQP